MMYVIVADVLALRGGPVQGSSRNWDQNETSGCSDSEICVAGVIVDKTSSRSVCLRQMGHEAQEWRFDYVADGGTTQQEMFQGEFITNQTSSPWKHD